GLASPAQRAPFRHLAASRTDRGPGNRLPIAVESRPRLDAMAELVERLGHDGRIRYRRDRDYLDWRLRNPVNHYRFLYWDESRLEGYLVLSRRASDLGGWQRVDVADLHATDLRIRSALLSAALNRGRFPELVTWTASFSDAEVQMLEGLGFVPVDLVDTVRGCPGILVRPVQKGLPSEEWELGTRHLLDIENWDIRVLYSMRG